MHLEEKYSVMMPRATCDAELTPHVIMSAARRAKPSAMGLDA